MLGKKWALVLAGMMVLMGSSAWAQSYYDASTATGNGPDIDQTNMLSVDGTTLYVMEDDNITSTTATGSVTVIENEAINIENSGIIKVVGLSIGDDTRTVTGDLYAAGSAGTIDATTFTVSAGSNVSGDENVGLTVTGTSTISGTYHAIGSHTFNGAFEIEAGGEYIATGTNHAFESGLIVKGTLSNDGANATVTLGKTTNAVGPLLDLQGKIASTGNTLTIANASTARGTIKVTSDSVVSGSIDATTGNGFALNVTSNLLLAGAGTQLKVNEYTQTGATVSNDAAFTGSGIWATDDTKVAQIKNGADFGANAVFDGGAAFTNGAYLVGNNNFITTNGVGKKLTFDYSSAIDLSIGDLYIDNYDSVELDGLALFGFDSSNVSSANHKAWTLSLGDTTVLKLGDTAETYFYDGFYTGYYNKGSLTDAPNARQWLVKGNIASDTGVAQNVNEYFVNIFGDYTYKYLTDTSETGGGGLWLDSYAKSSVEDYGAVHRQLGKIWGYDQISRGFAVNVAERGKVMLGLETGYNVVEGSVAGNINDAILRAYARNDAYASGYLHGDDRFTAITLDEGLTAAYNGHIAAGTNAVARGVSQEVMDTVGGKLDNTRAVVSRIRESQGSDSALAASILNSTTLNRVWVGGLGLWEDADRKSGFAGYKYDAGGAIIGYDRAFGNIVAGGAFSYVKGDYEDKSASAHDSTIKHYAFDLYGTYMHQKGFFGTLIGGFTYSDNDIRELRGGSWATEDYRTKTWHLGAKVGYDWKPNTCLTVSPSVGLTYIHAANSAHSYRQFNVNTLHYGKMKNHTMALPLEVKARYELAVNADAKFIFGGRVGYAYNFRDAMTNGSLVINGIDGLVPVGAVNRKSGRHTWNLGAEVRYAYKKFDLGVNYDYYAKSSYDAHRVMGTVGFSF